MTRAREPQRQVRHVEGAGHGVENAHRGQEERRRHQVEGDVLDGALELCALASQREQDEGRDQQHLEPDEQIEDVAGQEGAGHAHDQDVEQRIVAVGFPPPVHGPQGVDDDDQRHHAGGGHHDGAEQVGHQGDAERRDPVPLLHRLDAPRGNPLQEHDGDREVDDAPGQREDALSGHVAPHQQAACAHEQRDQDGQDDQGGHVSVAFMSSRSSVPTV